MNKIKIIFLNVFTLLTITVNAQDVSKLRVAVFDPTTSGTSIDEGTKLAVQELISSALVNTGRFTMVERSMLDKIIKEQTFQNSDMADNSQATEIGRLAGANKIILSAVSLVGGRNMLSIKVIDVQTATVDQQKTKIVNSGDLLDAIEPLTMELLGMNAVYAKQETQFTNIQQETPAPVVQTPVPVNNVNLPPGYMPIVSSKYSEGKDIVINVRMLQPKHVIKCDVLFEGNLVWSGDASAGFVVNLKDPNPGQKTLTLNTKMDVNKPSVSIMGIGGGGAAGGGANVFTIDTSSNNTFKFAMTKFGQITKVYY